MRRAQNNPMIGALKIAFEDSIGKWQLQMYGLSYKWVAFSSHDTREQAETAATRWTLETDL